MKIAVECKPDEHLIMGLGIPRKSIVHQNDKGDVCNFLIRNQGNIGLIDEDPGAPQPRSIRQATLISNGHGVKEFSDSLNNRIVVLCPKLEDWVLGSCRVSNIDPTSFFLPKLPNDLHKEINGKLHRFDDLVACLVAHKNPGILRLKSLLN